MVGNLLGLTTGVTHAELSEAPHRIAAKEITIKKILNQLSGFPAPTRSSGRVDLMAAREPLLH